MGFSVNSPTCNVLEGRGALRRGPRKPYITASRLRREVLNIEEGGGSKG